MTITLHASSTTFHPATLPHDDATFVRVEIPCPQCARAPLEARCAKSYYNEDRTRYRGDAQCVGCGAEVGMLEVEMSTIFGLEEDERMLNGRPRVY